MPADQHRPNSHLRDRLSAARLYLCTDARERQGDLPRFLDDVLSNGVDIVQLRQKGLEAGQELRYLEVFRQACAAHGALLAVNDRADVAYACGADVLHLGQDDLPVTVARQLIGPGPIIGLSSHAEAETAAASAEPAADYFCTGPVWPTPTKPGRPAPGLDLVRYAAGLGRLGRGSPSAASTRATWMRSLRRARRASSSFASSPRPTDPAAAGRPAAAAR